MVVVCWCVAELDIPLSIMSLTSLSRQTMSHIVESCPLTKLNGGLSQLHSVDDDAIAWLTNYGS